MDVKDNAMVVACADKMIYVFDLANPNAPLKSHQSPLRHQVCPPPPPSLLRVMNLQRHESHARARAHTHTHTHTLACTHRFGRFRSLVTSEDTPPNPKP